MWLLITIGAVLGGAMIVWHEVGRNKQLGFMLLSKYEQLLARAREERAKEAARARERAAEEAATKIETTKDEE